MEIKEDLKKLCEFVRPPGSKGEKEAAFWLKECFEKIGLKTSIEEFKYHGFFGSSLALHVFLAVLCLLIPYNLSQLIGLGWNGLSIITTFLLIFISISYAGECTGRFIWLRNILPIKHSQNVIGKLTQNYSSEKKRKTIIISGHYDAPRAGIIFHPFVVKNLGGKIAPLSIPFKQILIITVLKATEIFYPFLNSKFIYIIYILKIIVIILALITIILLLQYELSPPVQGASDNASGIIVSMAVAEILKNNPPYNSDIWILGSGSEEAHLIGMIEFIKKHKTELDKENTYFITMDTLGSGTPKYCESEGFMIKQYYPDQTLVKIAKNISAQEEFKDFSVTHISGHTDALISALSGYKSINLIGLDEKHKPKFYHWYNDTPENINYKLLEKFRDFTVKLVEYIDKKL